MSDDPLDETIRGKQDKLTIDGVDVPVFVHENVPPNAIYTVDELKRKIAESKAKTAGLHQFMVDEEKRQGELILINADVLLPPWEVDKLKRVGFGTCHIQQPDGAMKLVSVSIVAPQVDPWESRPGPAVMFERAKAMSNELFGSDARGKIIHDGEGNLIIDDMNAIQPEETARRAAYQAAYRKTLMGQYEEVQDMAHDMSRVLMQDLRDLWAIVRGWFNRQ